MDVLRSSPAASTIGCRLAFHAHTPVTAVFQITAALLPGVQIDERLSVDNNSAPLRVVELVGPDGTRQHLIHAEPGALTVTYSASVTEGEQPASVSEADRIVFLRPSRYCPSDRLAGFAKSHFGDFSSPVDRVRAICGYAWRHLRYAAGASGPTTDAAETLLDG